MRASIEQQGSIWPDAGDHVTDSDGQIYRVVASGGHISTPGHERGNVCHGYELELADWGDLDSDSDVADGVVILTDTQPHGGYAP